MTLTTLWDLARCRAEVRITAHAPPVTGLLRYSSGGDGMVETWTAHAVPLVCCPDHDGHSIGVIIIRERSGS